MPEEKPDASRLVSRRLITFLPHVGFLIGVLMWIVDAFVDSFILHPDEGFWEAMFAEAPTEMWMRTLVVIVITFSALVVQHFMRKQYKFEVLLLEQHAELERLVHERTLELQYLANFDELTGIYNRRRFSELLDGEMERARRYEQNLSLVMLDLDHFKSINDEYGHNEGDKVLKSVAEILRNHLRKSDIYGRWGGEEFVILMTHTDLATADKVAEKLRQLFLAVTLADGKSISASFGIASLRPEEPSTSFLKRVDEALYDAKRNGRNCVRVR